jgi:hypothetical protein
MEKWRNAEMGDEKWDMRWRGVSRRYNIDRIDSKRKRREKKREEDPRLHMKSVARSMDRIWDFWI